MNLDCEPELQADSGTGHPDASAGGGTNGDVRVKPASITEVEWRRVIDAPVVELTKSQKSNKHVRREGVLRRNAKALVCVLCVRLNRLATRLDCWCGDYT